MSRTRANYPVGAVFDVGYPAFTVRLHIESETTLHFDIAEGPYALSESVAIQVVALRNSIFVVSWQEKSGATVVNVQDFDKGEVHTHATLPSGKFVRMSGAITMVVESERGGDDRPIRNSTLVQDAMTSLFQRRDASVVAKVYSANYIQHNPHIPQGRDALAVLIPQLPKDLWYEPGLVIAEGDLVAIHGRITGWAEKPQIVVDIFRVEDGKLAEHWDVLQEEVVPLAGSSGLPMFDSDEGKRA